LYDYRFGFKYSTLFCLSATVVATEFSIAPDDPMARDSRVKIGGHDARNSPRGEWVSGFCCHLFVA
jgi:hypothetical protein